MLKKIYGCIVLLLFIATAHATPPCNVHANITQGNQTVCAGTSVTLDATPTGNNYLYSWSNGGATTASITFTASSGTTYTVTVTDTVTGCTGTDNSVITVNAIPNATVTPNNNNPICAHQTVNLQAGGGGTYVWSTGSHNNNINVSPSTTTTYTVTVTKNGCSATANATVTVNAAVLAGLFTNCNAVTVSPYTITLSDASSPSTGNTHYTIIWGDTGTTYSGATLPSPITHTYGAGSFNLVYIVTTSAGCIDTGYFTVRNLTNPSLAIGSPGNTLGCGPLPLCFPILNVTNNDASTTYLVDYGDGSATQTYNQPPPDTICHTYVLPSCGAPGIPNSVFLPNNFFYSITASNYCGTTAGAIGGIQVYTSPVAAFTVAANPICITSAVSLTNTSKFGYYANCDSSAIFTWYFGDGDSLVVANVLTTVTHTYAAIGSYNAVLVASNHCGSTSYTQTICVVPPPVAGFTLSTNVGCIPLTVNATNTSTPANPCSPLSYNWTAPYTAGYCGSTSSWGFSGATSASSANPIFVFSGSGTYTVTLKDSNTCGTATTTQVVTVKQPPQATITPISSSCQPYTVTPSATVVNCGTTALTYNWSSTPAGLSSTLANPPSTTFSTSGINTVNLSVTNECGTTAVSTSFNVSPQPTVTPPANTTVCPGTSVPATTLASVPAGATYTWTNSNTGIGLGASGSGDVPSFVATNTTGATISGTITVTPTINGCVGIPSTYTISVYPNPTVPAQSNVAVCAGSSVAASNFTSSPTGGTFNWTNSNSGIGLATGGSGNVPSFTGTNAGTSAITGTISVTATLNGCTGPATSYTITINPTPTVNVPAPITVCPGVAVPATTFTSNPSGGTFTWTNNITSTGLGASGTGGLPAFTSTNSTNAAITSTITVTPTANGCAGTPSSFTITVNPKPIVTAPSLPANSTICPGTAVAGTNFASTPAGATYTWTNNNTSIGLSASGTGNVPSFTGANSTGSAITATITVTPTVNGCAGTPSTYTITVSPNPTANVPASTTVCPGTIVPASSFTSTPAGATFAWTNSNTAIGLAASGIGNVPSFVATNSGSSAISGTISVTATLAGCSGAPSGYTITVSPPPTIATPPNDTICPGATVPAVTFTSTPAGATYTWTNSNTAIGLAASGTGTVPAFTATNATTSQIFGTIHVTPSLGGCAGTPVNYVVAVQPATAVTVPPNVAVCVGATIAASNFTSTPAGATFTWTNSNNAIGLAASGTGNVPSFVATNSTNAAITGTITVTANSSGCPGSGTTYTITVTPLPVVTVPANQTKCAGTVVAATAFSSTPAGATYTWTNDNTAIGLAASGSGNVPAFTATNATTAAITGNITVTPTLNGCSGPSSTYSITVNPIPTVTVPVSDTVCPGVVVSASNFVSTPVGATYTWANNNTGIGLGASGSGNVPAFTSTNASTALIVGTITVTPTLNGCAGTPNSYKHSVYPTPTVTAVANISVCAGATVAASAFTSTPAGATFSWTNNNPSIGLAASGTGNTPSFTATNSGSTTLVGTVTVTPTINGCPGTPITYSITVKPLPVIAAIPNDTVCAGAVIPATALASTPVGATYTWTNTNTLIGLAASGSGNVPSFTTTNSTGATISGTIAVTPTLNTCAGNPVSYVVVVNISPTVTVPANISVCTGATVAGTSLTSTPAGATFTWTNNNPAIGLASSGSGDVPSFTATNTTTSAITATISVVGTNGCSGPAATYTITVNPPPTVTVPANQTKCAGATVAATTFTSVPAGATFAWTNNNTAIGLAASGTGSVPSFTATNATNAAISAVITVTPTLNGCSAGTPSSYAITINPLPTIPTPANDTVCPVSLVLGTSFTSTPAGATYTWTNTNTAIGLTASGTGNVPPFASSNATTAAISGTIKVTPTLSGCAGNPVSYIVVVNPTPTVTVPASSSVCAGATVAASAFTSTPAGATFSWANTNPTIGLAASGTGNVPSFTATNPGISNVTATITVTPTLNGCTGTASTYTITVKPLPIFFDPSNDTVCAGTSVPVTTLSSIPSGATYAWTNTNTGIGLAASGTGNVPAFTATDATTGLISGTITVTPSLNGCAATAQTFVIAVNVAPNVTVPASASYCNGATVDSSNYTSNLAGTTFTWTNSYNGIGLGASGSGNTPIFTATNTGSAAITGTITVTPLNGCAGTPVSYNITVNPPPTVTVPASFTKCAGNVVAATSFVSTPTGATYAWTNSNTSIGLAAASGTGNVPSFTAVNATGSAVTTTITVTPTLNGCPGIASSYIITVNPLPVITAPTNVTVCPGTLLAATSVTSTPAGATYTWTNNNVAIGLSASGTGSVSSFTTTNASAASIVGTITITPTLNGCPGTAVSYTTTVYPTPTVTVPANVSVCVGGTVAAANFTSTPAGATFAWTNSNTAIGLAASGTGNIASFTATNATTSSIIGTITVTPTLNSCPGTPSNYTITVKPLPTVVLPASDTICPGAISAITAFTSTPTGATYTWINSNTAIGLGASGSGNVPAFTGTNATTAPIVGTITVTPTLNACVGLPVTYNKTINPQPNVTVPANIAACAGTAEPATNFTSNLTGTTFTWTNSNNAIGLAGSGSGNVPAFTMTNGSNANIVGTVTVTPVNSNGCTGTNSSYTITVYPAPAVTIPANQTKCAGVTVAATTFSSVPAGATYAWTNDNTSIGLAASGTGNVPSFTATNATTAAISGNITVTPTLNGCTGPSATYIITVNPLPVITVPASDTTCPGTAIAGTAMTSVPAGASFSWTNTNTGIGLPASGLGDVPAFTSANVTNAAIIGTIKVTPVLNGCTGPQASFSHTVNPLPAVTAITSVSVCVGGAVAATNFASTPAGATYTWTNNNTAIGLGASGSGNIPSFTSTNTTSANIIGTVFVTGTLNGCTGNATSYTITVKPLPTVTVPLSDTLCPGVVSAASVFSSTPTGATYTWTNTTTAIGLAASGSGNVPSFTTTNTTSAPLIGTISVTPTLNACPGPASTYSITVNPKPTTTAPANVSVCPGTVTTATSLVSNPVGGTFTWTNNNPAIGLAASGSGDVPSFTATNTGSTTLTGTVTITPTLNGCSGPSVSYTISVTPTPVVTPPANISKCTGVVVAASSFSSTPAGATYAWTNDNTAIGLAASGTGNVPSFTTTNGTPNAIVGNITVTPTLNTCVGAPVTYTITVNPAPVVTVPANDTVCYGTPIAAANFTSVPVGATYAWTNSNAAIGLAGSGTGNVPAFTATNTGNTVIFGTIAVTPTLNTCVGTPASYVVVVNPAPAVTLPANFTVCPGATVAAATFTSAPVGATYTWTNSNPLIGLGGSGSGSVPAFTAGNTTSAAISGTITVTPTLNGCVGPAKTYVITVSPQPIANVPVSDTICQGALVAASAFTSTPTGATFAWTNTNNAIGLGASGTGNTPAFTATNTTVNPIAGTITVTPTLNGCTGNPASYTVTVNPLPVVTVPASTTVCQGAVIAATNFTSNVTGTTYGWTNNNINIGLAASGAGNVPSFTAASNTTNPITGTITVTPTAGGCPGATASYAVTVKPTPVITTTPAIDTICSATPVYVQLAASVPGTTISWTVNSPIGVSGEASGNGDSILQVLANSGTTPQTIVYAISASVNGCNALPDSVDVVVNPGVLLQFSAGLQTICSGQTSQTVYITSSLPTPITWVAHASGVTGVIASGTDSIPAQTLINSGNVGVVVDYDISAGYPGCPDATSTYSIIVNPPSAVAQPQSQTVCGGVASQPFIIDSNALGVKYVWTATSPDGITGFTVTDTSAVIASQILTNPNTVAGIVVYTIQPPTVGCPGVAVNDTVTVEPAPVITLPAEQIICSGVTSTAVTPVSTIPAATVNWTAIYNGNITGFTASGLTTIPAQTLTNTSTTTDSVVYNIVPAYNGCSGPALNYAITVSPFPDVILPPSQSICSGASTVVAALSSDASGATFSWTATATPGVTGFTASGTGDIPVQTLNNTGTTAGTVTYAITPSANGCTGPVVNYAVTVKPLPIASATLDTICSTAQSNVTLSSNVANTTFTWTVTAPGTITGAVSGSGTTIQQTLTSSSATVDSVLYVITPTANGCTGPAINTSVVVNPATTVQFGSPNQSVCSGQSTQSVQITGSIAGGTYNWTSQANGVTGVAASGTDSIPVQTLVNNTSFPVSVIYTVTTGGSGACPSNPANYVITVNPTPVVSVPPATTICSGNASQVIFITSNINGTTYGWTGASPNGVTGFTASGTSTVIPSTILTNTGAAEAIVVYTITPGGGGGCPGVAVTDTIYVEPSPVASLPVEQIICSAGTSTVVTPTSTIPGTTFTWNISYNGNITGYTTSGTGNIPAQTLTNTGSTTDSIVYNIVPSFNGCSGPAVNYAITVSPFLDVLLPATQSICSGASTVVATLNSDAAGATFSWTATATAGVNGFTASGTGNIPVQTLTNSGTNSGTVTYTVTPTANGCVGTPSDYMVTVKPQPVASATPDTICSSGQSNVVITSTVTGTTYTWTATAPGTITGSSNGNGAAIQQVLNSSSASADSVLYFITPTASGCAGPVVSTSVVVNPVTTVQFSGPNQTVCSGQATQSVQITGSVPGGTYSWTSQANGVTGVTASGNDSIPVQTLVNTTNAPVAVIYTVTTGGGGACPSNPASYTITVNPTPAVIVPPATTVCSGNASQVIFVTSNINGTTFTWTGASPDGVTGFTASGNTTVIPSNILINTGTTEGVVVYTITPNVGGGCPGVAANDTIYVEPIPVASLPAEQTICSAGTTVAVTATSTLPGTVFAWNLSRNGNITGYTTSGTGTIPAQTLTNTGSTTDSIIYNIAPSFNGCNGTPVNYAITVSPFPDVILPPTQSICSGASTVVATLSSDASGATFSWTATATAGVTGFTANGTGNIPAQTLTNTSNTAGTVTYTVTPTANGCVGTPSDYVVTVKPQPVASATPDTICSSAQTNVLLTSNVTGTTFTWTVTAPGTITGASNGNGTSIQQILNSTSAGADSAIYFITPSANGCPGPVLSTSVVVNPATTVQFSAPNQTICSGQSTQSVQITGSVAGGTYNWTSQSNGVTGVTASGTDSIPVQTLVNTTNFPLVVVYSVSAGNGTCPSSPANYQVVVNPGTTAIVPPAQTVCSGVPSQPVVITSNSNNTTFAWTASSPNGVTGFTASGNTAIIPSQNLSNTSATSGLVIYSITASSSGCPGVAVNDSIFVLPLPVITPIAPQTICGGNTTTAVTPVASVAGTTFNWDVIYDGDITGATASGTGTIPAQTLTNNGTTTDSVVYNIVPVAGGCNGPSINFDVVVNSGPDVILPAAQVICSGASSAVATLSSHGTGVTFNWTASATAGVTGFTASGTGDIPVQTLNNPGITAGTVTYAITSSAGGGCTGPVVNYVITVNPLPVASAAPDTICSGTQTNVVITSTINNTTYTWTVTAPGSVTGAANGSGSSIQQVLTNTSGTAQTVTYAITPSANGCAGAVTNAAVVVNTGTNIQFSVPNQTICSGQNTQSVQITGSTPGGSYPWTSQANGVTGVAASGADSIPVQTLTNNTSDPVTVIYTVNASSGACPSSPANYEITVNPVPVATQPAPQTVCSGVPSQVIFITTDISGTTLTWTGASPNGVTGFSPSGTSSFVIPSQTMTNSSNTAGTVIYTITPSYAGCPGAPVSATITVNPVPVISPMVDQAICSGATTTAVTPVSSLGGTTFNWTVIYNGDVTGYTASGTGNITAQTLINSGLTTDSVVYQVTSTAGGCNGAPVNFNVVVTSAPDVLLPNPQTICSGASTTAVTLNSDAAGATFSWTATATAGVTGFTANGTGNIPVQTLTNTGNTAGTVTYSITATANGCPGNATNYVVTVQPLPVASAPTDTICPSSQSNIPLTSTIPGTTFAWVAFEPAGVTGAVNGNGSVVQQVISNSNQTAENVLYVVTPSANGCVGSVDSVILVVNPGLLVQFTPGNQTICSGQNTQSVTITGSLPNAVFNWTSQANGVTGVAASGTNTIPVQTLVNPGTFPLIVDYNVNAGYANCPNATATYSIVVNPAPSVILPAAQTVCPGVATNSVALSSNVAGTTFTWTGSSANGVTGFTVSGGGNVIPPQTLSNPNTTAGQLTYVVTPSANACVGVAANYVITVNPTPDVIVPQPQTICSGSTSNAVTLSSNIAGTTFSWTSSADVNITGNTASGTGNIPAQTLTNSGNAVDTVTYVITPADNTCTGPAANYYIIINPAPTVVFAPQNQTLCSGQTSQLVNITSNVPGSNITWTATVPNGVTGAATSGTNTIPAQTLFNSTVNMFPQPLSVTYTAVAASVSPVCQGVPANYTITVEPVPTFNFVQNSTSGCSPLSVDVTPVTTNFGNPDTLVFNWGDGTPNTTVHPNGVAPQWFSTNHNFYNNTNAQVTYTITMIAHSGCGDTTITSTVTVIPSSVNAAFTASPTNGCAPLVVTLHDQSTGPGLLNWCFDFNRANDSCMGAGQVDSTGATITYTFATGSHTVALYAANSFGCAHDSAFVTINVDPSPVSDFTFVNNACATTPVAFTQQATVPAGSTITQFDWHFGTGDASIQPDPFYSFAAGGTYNVCLNVTTSNGCSDSICKPVTTLVKPAVNFTAIDTCANTQPIQFTNISTGATSYAWNFGDGNISVLDNPGNNFAADGTYQVTLIGYTGSCADTVVKPVTIYPVPTAAFTAPGPYTCGSPATVQMTNNSQNAGGYTWDFGNGTSSTATNPIATYNAQGNFVVTLAAANHFGCVDTARSNVQIYAKPAVQSFNITPLQGCQPVLVNFAVNATNANTFIWNFGDGSTPVTGSAVETHTYTEAGSYPVTLEVYNFGTCGDTVTVPDTVLVHSLPTADFDYTMNTVVDSAIGQVQFINNSTNSTSYLWSFGDGDSSTLINPSYTYPDIEHYIVKLVAANQYGCIDSTTKDIYVVKKSLYVPNAFAPEFNAGSSLVQVWKPAGMGLLDYRAQIFNKWGELLWESTAITADDMKEPAEGWDGTYQGKLCQQGVYVWKIEAVFLDGSRWKGMSYKFQDTKKTIGDVTLIR